MGARGPIPNRDSDLARPRARKGSDQQETKAGELRPVVIPESDPDWHPIAKMLWDSLELSGQSDFYQQSDWAFAYSLCEDLTRYKEPLVNQTTGEFYYKRNGQILSTIYSALNDLMVTEGARRRLRVELSAPQPEQTEASVTALADYRAGLGLVAPLDESEN